MTKNHSNQQNILNNQSNELMSPYESIQGEEELNEAELNSIHGGVLKWCAQENRWVDDGTYHLMPSTHPQ